VIHYINGTKDKNHVIISVATEKCIRRNVSQLRASGAMDNASDYGSEDSRRNVSQHDKGKHIANIILNGEILEASSLIRNQKRMTFLSFLFNTVLEILAREIRQKKEAAAI
jgi:hypothetical protein